MTITPAPAPARARAGSAGYQLFMLILCVFALVLLVIEAIYRHDRELVRVLEYADSAVCAVFFIDFLITLKRAPDKVRYLYTWGWLDLLSSVPTLDMARWGRLARIARLTRILRVLRASRVLTKMLVHQRGQSAVLAAALIALVLLVACSAAVIHFETAAGGNIQSADDAVWWAFTTITTVGYGDRYPITGEGRLIAALLMTAGVGLFGAFSAALAAWFLSSEVEAKDEKLAELRGEIADLRKTIEDRLPRPF